MIKQGGYYEWGMWHACERNSYRVSMGKPKGMRPTVWHKYRSEDNT